MNAEATVISANVRDFQLAKRTLELRVMTPVEFLSQLTA